MKYKSLVVLSLLMVFCNRPEPRRPINKKKSSTENYSILINKKIRKLEEQLLEEYIQKDTLLSYQFSPFGFAYAVTQKSKKTKEQVNKNTLYRFEKTVYNLNDELIYPKKIIKSRVATSDLIVGIKEGVKLMHEDEEIKFIFTSFVAHGFSGDGKKIKANMPIVVKIKLLNINN
ncbi:FKBP-type peptidyl-prolyl cis-trans isomerase [Ochrovirga pacifica]|uniref:FKBP-type peptidyl-prolyl cis-trans isomerase n=1 Tax=Ochrovirga pacifica TaxID=1042376 RepID=UPI000255A29B|nr:peptidyl-prolyl isomerase gliding motility-associated protein [Ochrovirga pacifica]